MKDYYRILDVSPDATQAEIRSAYRRRARAIHPDCSDQDGQSFRELQEGYEVLGDPARRRAYDRERRSVPVPGSRGEGSGLFELLQAHFGSASPAAGMERPATSTLRLRVRITPEEARYGGEIRARLALSWPCSHCRGSGVAAFYRCTRCGGAGAVQESVPLAFTFPPGMGKGETAHLSLAQYDLQLVLTFTVAAPSAGGEW